MKLSNVFAGIDRQFQEMTEWHVALLAALVGVVGLSMPWVWADDHDTPYRAYGLMVHWITATDKWYLVQTALLDSLVATAGSAGIITFTLYSAAKMFITRRVGFDTTLRSVFVLCLCAAILFLCDNLLDPDRPQLGAAAAPGIGLVLVAVSAAVLCVMGARGAYRDAVLKEQMERMMQNTVAEAAPAETPVQHQEPETVPALETPAPDDLEAPPGYGPSHEGTNSPRGYGPSHGGTEAPRGYGPTGRVNQYPGPDPGPAPEERQAPTGRDPGFDTVQSHRHTRRPLLHDRRSMLS